MTDIALSGAVLRQDQNLSRYPRPDFMSQPKIAVRVMDNLLPMHKLLSRQRQHGKNTQQCAQIESE